MAVTMFTQHQRDILRRRIERAILWSQSAPVHKDAARSLAMSILDELEVSGFSAAAQRRAIENIADRLEKSA